MRGIGQKTCVLPRSRHRAKHGKPFLHLHEKHKKHLPWRLLRALVGRADHAPWRHPRALVGRADHAATPTQGNMLPSSPFSTITVASKWQDVALAVKYTPLYTRGQLSVRYG